MRTLSLRPCGYNHRIWTGQANGFIYMMSHTPAVVAFSRKSVLRYILYGPTRHTQRQRYLHIIGSGEVPQLGSAFPSCCCHKQAGSIPEPITISAVRSKLLCRLKVIYFPNAKQSTIVHVRGTVCCDANVINVNVNVIDRFYVWNHRRSQFRPTGPPFTSLSTDAASMIKCLA